MWKRLLSCAVFVLLAAATSRAQGWRGIVPLRSTRADAERLLGPPEPGASGIYRLGNERVIILYADGPCGVNSGGWNVPGGTIISISVMPDVKPRFADLRLDVHKFSLERGGEIEFIVKYVNEEEGISYEVNTGGGLVESIRYFPTARDSPLRCPTSGVPATATLKVAEYSNSSHKAEARLLDSFAQLIIGHPTAQAYVLVYADGRAGPGKAKAHAERIGKYLVRTRKVDPRRIVTVEGGKRRELTVELYLVPFGAVPPVITPATCPE